MNNQIKKLVLFLSFISFLSFSACSDDSTGPETRTEATFSLLVSNSSGLPKVAMADSFNVVDASGSVFTIKEARANVRHIQFDYPEEDSRSKDEDTTNQISLEGPFIIDLMRGTSTPQISAFSVEPGTYKRIDVRLDDTKSSDAIVSPTDELLNNTLVIKGTFDYKGISNRNFTFKLKFNEDVRFETPTGIVIQEGASRDILLKLHVDEWLQNIDITKCLDDSEITLEANGDLIIDDLNDNGNCSDFENTIKHNIKNNYDFD